jgi:hypothetical protein
VAQARSLTFIQRFQVPLRHRALPLSGNSAAVESFARSGHGGKDVLAGVLTFRLINQELGKHWGQLLFGFEEGWGQLDVFGQLLGATPRKVAPQLPPALNARQKAGLNADRNYSLIDQMLTPCSGVV